MTKRKLCIVVGSLAAIFLLIVLLNFYFLTHLSGEQSLSAGGVVGDVGISHGRASSRSGYFHLVRKRVKSLKPMYLNRNPKFYSTRNKIWRNFLPAPYENVSLIWDITYWWPQDNEIYPAVDSIMGQLMYALQHEEIISAKNAPKGTQMKLLLQLAGKQKVIFKPKWYEPNAVIDGPIYSGKDRHFAEIVAFYLGAILNLRWTPIAVGRKINLKEIYHEKADKLLRSTMLVNEEQTEYCVYGKCFYCAETEAVCGNEEHMIEGVILYLVAGTLVKQRSPWQRTYKDNQLAPWEENMDYCSTLHSKISHVRLLDLIDAAVFDFLLQNGDRHHYETRNDRVVLIDNGKGFGNPSNDAIDILAPLYQCCMMRKSTWDRLLIFSGGTLSELIEQLTKRDLLYPILTSDHLKAIDRRMLILFSAMEICFERFGKETVLK